MMHTMKDISNTLEQIAREEELSHAQYQKLVELEKLDLLTLEEVIKEKKLDKV